MTFNCCAHERVYLRYERQLCLAAGSAAAEYSISDKDDGESSRRCYYYYSSGCRLFSEWKLMLSDMLFMNSSSQPATSIRWSATPEQLTILDDMYRGGIHNPNAQQVMEITAQLSLYGKTQPKNVFYWFQNHKAREKQKLRFKHMDNSKQKMLGAQASRADEGKNEYWKLGINSTEEYSKSVSSCGSMKHDWVEVDTGSDMASRTRPLQTLELFPLSGGLRISTYFVMEIIGYISPLVVEVYHNEQWEYLIQINQSLCHRHADLKTLYETQLAAPSTSCRSASRFPLGMKSRTMALTRLSQAYPNTYEPKFATQC
eukprot:Gb_27283 [translate_table: standard]